MHYPNSKILIFAKAPIAGQVKTRLISHLGETGAANLHSELVLRTLSTATQAGLCPVELWCAPNTQHPFFVECSERFNITLQQQHGNDIGQRMAHAFAKTLADDSRSSSSQCQQAILIGCDCPGFTAAYLDYALALLSQGCDAVIGPATDGGYVLIGMSRYHPDLFLNISWSTEKVSAQTYRQLESLGYDWAELSPLSDIDLPSDLENYYTDERPLCD